MGLSIVFKSYPGLNGHPIRINASIYSIKLHNFSSVIFPSKRVYTFLSWDCNKLLIKFIILFKLGILKLPIKIPKVLHSFAFSIKLNLLYNSFELNVLDNIWLSKIFLSLLKKIVNISLTLFENLRDNSVSNESALLSPIYMIEHLLSILLFIILGNNCLP